ncbi:glycosyltransferase [Victivallis vadensis]|uniref:Glycosyltransferase involved in cell wall biosynthesis n=1 Tax=Victivallis vadensis TaxID=172901 RepID=A0A2U1B4G8_9BACT|nr:glycosyltransferase [Victivallis vadensis]PVY43575.1 glycosyltransferase involved in cell wall biosynthesis [Victivallis vadensis]
MRIIHVCYHDIRGGAALAARRLHLELLRTGHESRFMLVEQSGDTEQAIRLPALFRCRCRIEQRLEALAFRHANRNRLTPQSLNLFPTSIAARINRENPDVVNLHWINGASSAIWDLPRIHAPVVWTLHDTWPYCATEHYHDNNDLRFVTGYREPAPNGSFWQPLVWKCKRKNWNGWTPEIVAPSNWIAGEAQSSELMHRLPITPIANGVDLAVFRPSDRLKARQTLRLPPNARIILFGAYNAADRNKGGPELTAALRRLSRRFSEPLLLLAVGSNTKMPDFGIPTVFTGRLDTEQQMATAYAAADATVLASKYDNLPNILVESLACGIPAAAFATGGIPEIMEDRVSGALAEPFQPESLADALAWILEHPHPEQLAAAARHRAESCFDIRDCARRYSGLYAGLRQRFPSPSGHPIRPAI